MRRTSTPAKADRPALAGGVEEIVMFVACVVVHERGASLVGEKRPEEGPQRQSRAAADQHRRQRIDAAQSRDSSASTPHRNASAGRVRARTATRRRAPAAAGPGLPMRRRPRVPRPCRPHIHPMEVSFLYVFSSTSARCIVRTALGGRGGASSRRCSSGNPRPSPRPRPRRFSR